MSCMEGYACSGFTRYPRRMDKVGDLGYVIIDTRDMATGVGFWSRVLGRPAGGGDPPFTDLVSMDTPVTVSVQQVERWEHGQTGVHIDIRVRDLDVAIEQVRALGGELVEIRGDTQPWAVMTDPDGNTFCLVLS